MAPGKRPRLTPNPALAMGDDGFAMPFGTPGGDVQIQAMLQTFVNIVVYGMNPQAAVEAPRFATMSFPNSFEPHEYHPGKLMLEARIPEAGRRYPRRLGPRGRVVAGVGLARRRHVRAGQGRPTGHALGWGGPAAAGLRARLVGGRLGWGAAS